MSGDEDYDLVFVNFSVILKSRSNLTVLFFNITFAVILQLVNVTSSIITLRAS